MNPGQAMTKLGAEISKMEEYNKSKIIGKSLINKQQGGKFVVAPSYMSLLKLRVILITLM